MITVYFHERKRTHFWTSVAISALAPLTVLAGASQAQTPSPIPVYGAQAAGVARVGAWGNGSAEAANGGSALSVTVRNFDEGAHFDLAKPIDLAPYHQTGFWRLRVQLNNASQRGGGRDRNQTGGRGNLPQEAPLTQLRIKLMLDKGAMSGVLPISQDAGGRGGRGGRGGAQTLLLPVRSMTSTADASGLVRRLILTGDSTATFSLEQIELVAETDSITAAVRRADDPAGTDLKDITVKPGQGTTLVADVNGGTSDIVVTWNFDADNSGSYPAPNAGRDAGRGGRGGAEAATAAVAPRGVQANAQAAGGAGFRPRVDAVGASVQPNWPNEEQDYRVEVTIADRSGKKSPVRKSILVQVRG